METSSSDSLLTIKEAAKLLKVHWQTVRNYIKEGKLAAIKIGRNVRIKQSEIDKFIHKTKDESKEVEIEVRFIIENRKPIEQKLLDLDTKIIYHGHVIDHWFEPNYVKSMKQKEKLYDSTKGYGLRIREQDNGYTGKISTSLEVKRLLIPEKHDTCLEHEIDISNYNEGKKLLKLMNFKEIVKIDKDRVVYRLDGVKVIIDSIKDYKTGVEIEIITKKDRDEVIPKLLKVAEKLGLDPEKDITKKSLTYQAMKDMARF